MTSPVEKYMIELGELVEELQDEIETFETARRSPTRVNMISHLVAAVMAQAQLLHQSIHSAAGSDYREAH